MLHISKKAPILVNGMLYAVVIALFMLTVLSGALLSVQLTDFVRMHQREVLLTSNMKAEIDLFSVQYENASGEITVTSVDGRAVIAPGTSAEYPLHLRNADKTAIDYEIIPTVTYMSDYSIPVRFRMLDDKGNYVIGDASTWVSAEDLSLFSSLALLPEGESAEYCFEWKWDYESGNDSYDTLLGAVSDYENVGLNVKITVRAEPNTEIESNGGFMSSQIGSIAVLCVAFVLPGASGVLVAVFLLKRRKSQII